MIDQIINTLQAEEKSAEIYTENGAKVNKTSGKKLLDMNFRVASYRGMSEDQIWNDFIKAFNEDRSLAVKWLFYVRDIREGLGERRLFRIILTRLVQNYYDQTKLLLNQVADFGRWDDLFDVYQHGDINLKKDVISIISSQLSSDIQDQKLSKGISLLAKWLPSEGASSKATRNLAREFARELQLTPVKYRKIRSALNKYLKTVEIDISSKNYSNIDYERVPSKANIRYASLFLRKDQVRRQEFLKALEKGEKKINSSVNFPHDIVHMYASRMTTNWHRGYEGSSDQTIEALWKALPNYGISDTLVVADGSGSMQCLLPGSNVEALEVAHALAIYCSEHNSGPYRNKYITFSANPKYVSFKEEDSLLMKLRMASQNSEVSNTNIEKVFALILKTAIDNKLSQEEMVKNILIISDMEFDSGTDHNDAKLFDNIKEKYKNAGFELPRLSFWNVNSRSLGIPVNQNDRGVALLSGFSPSLIKMVMSNEIDPYKALVEILNSDRYALINWS